MKRITTIVLFLVLAATATVRAQMGIGVILGEPTGLSMKLSAGSASSFDAAAAWSFLQQEDRGGIPATGGSIYFHLDYQQYFDLVDVPSGRLPFFVGVGGKIYLGTDILALGVRIPLGVSYEFADVPLELFLEVAPGLLFFPSTTFDGGGGFGILYRL